MQHNCKTATSVAQSQVPVPFSVIGIPLSGLNHSTRRVDGSPHILTFLAISLQMISYNAISSPISQVSAFVDNQSSAGKSHPDAVAPIVALHATNVVDTFAVRASPADSTNSFLVAGHSKVVLAVAAPHISVAPAVVVDTAP